MSPAVNGDKSKVIFFLLGILQAIVLTWAWRIDGNLAAAKIQVTTLEANYQNIEKSLFEMKGDIKTILKERRR